MNSLRLHFRNLIRWALMKHVVLAIVLLASGLGGRLWGAERPNIVLIISDDHAWTDYGFMGHPQIRTPHLDRLARESSDVPPRLRPLQSVLSQPGVDHHRVVPTPAQDHEQRSSVAAGSGGAGFPSVRGICRRP